MPGQVNIAKVSNSFLFGGGGHPQNFRVPTFVEVCVCGGGRGGQRPEFQESNPAIAARQLK